MDDYLRAFGGGVLIGLSALALLFFNGRILGVSGILGGVLRRGGDKAWRFLFLAGLLSGGVAVFLIDASAFSLAIERSPLALIAAGLLVGYGTRLGNGCTSGHGVCGMARLSSRSLFATLTFIGCGAATVFVINHFFEGRL